MEPSLDVDQRTPPFEAKNDSSEREHVWGPFAAHVLKEREARDIGEHWIG